ncbi:beta-1,4-N-acetylgalactosaminyltransferase bre-4-like [Rhipicephalus sanguineus]|uniref:beta-1,4-N-acetylgalactosaminyltransferase bre-4-like n=1 Tax=Rhipicephalus sanguineus TaxID=34632 RepID=UPI0018953450|nr:beta-1,4-N-acetylgalactosaminyltransferase bre-4-like [Rhipicephalus sanguineus]
MVLVVVVVTLLFTEHKVVDPEIGNPEPFVYTDATRRNLGDRTRSRHQRRAPLKVTPGPNFCSVNWKGGSDLLHVRKEGPPLSVLEKAMPHVMPGGRWFPTGCTARHRVAIVVPYRDRLSNLQAFLQHMHPFLQSQQLDYGIYVVEQNDADGFKRAKLFNAGYEIIKAMHNHSCFIFHDVDLLPENRRNVYACNKGGPFHLPTCIDQWKYKVLYSSIFGGVCAMHITHMEKVNGFSNLFSKWGGEDDDMSRRCVAQG